MRRLTKLAAALAVSGALLLGAGATPAQAHYSDGTLQGVYQTRSECLRVGNLGEQNGLWGSVWWCELHQEYQNGLFFLWSFT